MGVSHQKGESMSKSKRCLSCKYCKTITGTASTSKAKDVVANYYYCDFLAMNRRMRGCPGGDECTEYVQKRTRRKKTR